MKQEPASKNKDGTIIQFPLAEKSKKSTGVILFPVLSGILCAAVFGLILNMLLEKPDQQPLLAEPPEETSLFESPAFTFWVLQAGAFSSVEAAEDFTSGMSADTAHVLVKQDDMILLWIGAAASEDLAKALAAKVSGEVYIKQVSVSSIALEVSEADKKWLTEAISAINQKLASPDQTFAATESKSKSSTLHDFQQAVQHENKETAFLQSLGALIQLEQKHQE